MTGDGDPRHILIKLGRLSWRVGYRDGAIDSVPLYQLWPMKFHTAARAVEAVKDARERGWPG